MNEQTPISILDLKTQYRAIRRMIEESVTKVLASGNYILGPEVDQFEKDFSFYLKSKHTIGVNSGTDALYLAMRSLGIGEGDEVITTPCTFIATCETILRTGAKPVFVDVKESDSNINPDLIEAKITKKTKAILPVHLYGFVCDMQKIKEIAQAHKLFVIEDCAQSAGAYHHSDRVGVIGDAGCFSFYPTKNLAACGDGGAITVQTDRMAEHLKALRTHGSTWRGYYDEFGVNSRLDEVQAAILRVKLLYIDRWNQLRRQLASHYDDLLTEVPEVQFLKPMAKTTPVYCLYYIRVKRRDTLQESLAQKGITTMVHYPVPLHLVNALKFLGHKTGSFPVAEQLSEELLALPMYPELTYPDQERIIQEISVAVRS